MVTKNDGERSASAPRGGPKRALAPAATTRKRQLPVGNRSTTNNNSAGTAEVAEGSEKRPTAAPPRPSFGLWVKAGCPSCKRTTEFLDKSGESYVVHAGGIQEYMRSDAFHEMIEAWNSDDLEKTPFRSTYPVVVRYGSGREDGVGTTKVSLLGGYEETIAHIRGRRGAKK
jgi:glutaredoxin